MVDWGQKPYRAVYDLSVFCTEAFGGFTGWILPCDEGSVIKTVEFVEHKGYYVFSATVNRYTIGVCLVKEKDEIGEFIALMAGIKKEGEGQ